MRLSELRHVPKQFDLNLFLRVEMSEQPALRHPDLIRQRPERDFRQSRLAHQRETMPQDSLARRFRILSSGVSTFSRRV